MSEVIAAVVIVILESQGQCSRRSFATRGEKGYAGATPHPSLNGNLRPSKEWLQFELKEEVPDSAG